MSRSVPVTAMNTESGENGRLWYAVSAMQGYREAMEDAHRVVLDLDAATATSFFGVYDGHGGPAVSKYCAKHLHNELRKHADFGPNPITAIEGTFLRMDEKMKTRKAAKELCGYGGNEFWENYKKAIRSSRFLPFCVVQKPPYDGPTSDGCTACVVLIRGNQIIVANAGDSRCVLSRSNQPIALSIDHKPNVPGERVRIENAGRNVTVTEERGNIPRIDEGIAISRSLGDMAYKNVEGLSPLQQPITAFPEVRTEDITHDSEFLIIACDGIWDCMTNRQAVDFVRIYLTSENMSLAAICEAMLTHCLATPRGRDNMTVMLVRFKITLPPPPPLPPQNIPPAGSDSDDEAPPAATKADGASSSHS